MDDILFSLNTVLPIFLLILLGFLLNRFGMFRGSFVDVATNVVFYVALPASIFTSVAESDFFSVFDLKYVLFLMGSTVASFLLAWGLAKLTVRDPARVSAFVHGAFRGNFVYVGLAIIRGVTGGGGVSFVLVIAFVVPLYNVLAVVVLSACAPGEKKRLNWGKIGLDLIKNPMILATLAGLCFSLPRIPVPELAAGSLGYLANLATPLALLLVGASIRPKSFGDKGRDIIAASLYKAVLMPLLFLPIAIRLNFSSDQIVTAFAMLAAPTALNSYIMTRKMGGDEELGAGVVFFSTLFSAVALPVGVMLLRRFGLV